MFGKIVIVAVGLAVLGFIFSSLRHTTDPAVNAISIVAGNGADTTEVRGSSTLPGRDEETRYAKMDDVVCRWVGREVVVSARITNTSPQPLTIRWEPEYELQTHTGGGFNSPEQVRKLAPHQATTVLARERPIGLPAGTGIIACTPQLYATQD